MTITPFRFPSVAEDVKREAANDLEIESADTSWIDLADEDFHRTS
jgi:hypothetical protein